MALVVPYINASAVHYANRQQPPVKPGVRRVQRVQPVEPKRYSSEQQEAYRSLEKRYERILEEENKKGRRVHTLA